MGGDVVHRLPVVLNRLVIHKLPNEIAEILHLKIGACVLNRRENFASVADNPSVLHELLNFGFRKLCNAFWVKVFKGAIKVIALFQDGDPACTLSSALRPSNPYSASKAAGDLLIGAAIRTYGIRARITRCTNNFGPHQAAEKFLPTIIRNALKNQPIPVYGEGKQKRDWLYVTDHTDAIELVLQQGEDGCTYLISADDERSNLETAKHVLHALKKPHDLIQFVSDRPGHDWRYALDSSSVKALGWKPCISFADGLQKTIEFYM